MRYALADLVSRTALADLRGCASGTCAPPFLFKRQSMRQLQGMKPLIPTVYQFTFGIADFKGFSLHQDSTNLPVLCGAPDRNWRFVRAIPMAATNLRPFAGDAQIALAESEDPRLPHRAQHGRAQADHSQNITTGLASPAIVNAIRSISPMLCNSRRTRSPRRSMPCSRRPITRRSRSCQLLPVLTVLSLVVGSHGHSRCRAHFSPSA